MIYFTEGTLEHISTIKDIAERTWAVTYTNIISQSQIDYMLDMMYSDASLTAQMTTQRHHFLLIKSSESASFKGFVSFEYDYKNTNTTKLHKLYVLPQSQGSGLGRILIDLVCERAKTYGNDRIRLNMNRDNKALGFYKNVGFEIVGEEDINIGKGYLMEDYIFEKRV